MKLLATFGLSLATLAAPGLPGFPPASPSKLTLKDTRGRTVRPLKTDGRRATLLVFVGHDCPISNALAAEVGRICSSYAKKGIKSYIVYPDHALKPTDAERHRIEFAFPCSGLQDKNRKLVRFTGVTKVPEAAVVGKNGAVVYRGRIDDTYFDYGKRRDEPRNRDLRRALDAYLAGRPVRPRVTPVVGCDIGAP